MEASGNLILDPNYEAEATNLPIDTFIGLVTSQVDENDDEDAMKMILTNKSQLSQVLKFKPTLENLTLFQLNNAQSKVKHITRRLKPRAFKKCILFKAKGAF